jgi:hypothetical protein
MAATPNISSNIANSMNYLSGTLDDGYFTIELPWSMRFLGLPTNTIYVGTNSYITVGAGSSAYNVSALSPSYRKLFIAALDNIIRDLVYTVEGTSPNRTACVKYSGVQYSSYGGIGANTIKWEVTFYENANGISNTNTNILVYVVENYTYNNPVYIAFGGLFTEDTLVANISLAPGTATLLQIDSDISAISTPVPQKTLTISATSGSGNGEMMIAKYGTSLSALSNPLPYVTELYFHSGLPYVEINAKISTNSSLTFPAVPRRSIPYETGGGGHGGGVCFAPSTQISMFDGSKKPIKEIVIGDLVWNSAKTNANTVTFIEKAPAESYQYLYSHNASFKPFATLNHPLYINGKYTSPIPESYIWLDTEYLEPVSIAKTNNICDVVYNLWTTNDHTYIVNDVGTHSIVDDGGAMLHCYQQELITAAQCSDIIIDLSSDSPEHLYGAYLINNFIKKFNYSLINKLLVYFAVSSRKTTQRQLFKVVSKIVGTTAKYLRKI